MVKKCDGTMCRHGKAICGEDNFYLCCLPKGHKGNHIACGDIAHNLKIWPQKKTLAQKSKTKRKNNNGSK